MPSIEASSKESDVSDRSSSLVSVDTSASGNRGPLTTPEDSGVGGDKDSLGSLSKSVVASSCALHEFDANVPSFDDSVMQRHDALFKSSENLEEHQISVHLPSQKRQDDTAGDCGTSSAQLRNSFTKELDELSCQIQSDVITEPQDDQAAMLPGVLSIMEPRNGQDAKFPCTLISHFDLESGGLQKSPSSGSPFRTIITK